MKIKTKTIKRKALFLAFAACFMSVTVLLSAAHAKDLVSNGTRDPGAIARTTDPVAKAIGDLHNHTSKQTLKTISIDSPVTARGRENGALNREHASRSLLDLIEDTLAFYRLAFSLRVSLAFA